jgi:hypothetical protein
MFLACEKWRKEFGVDEIVASFHYTEKAEVSKYYPQYYHKTDVVCTLFVIAIASTRLSNYYVAGWTTYLH